MKNKFWVLLLFLITSVLNAYCQIPQMKLVNDIEVDSFPTIKMKINVKGAPVLNTENLIVLENNNQLNAKIELIDTLLPSNRNTLVLVENLRQVKRNRFLLNTLKNALKYIVKPGDSVRIASFDRIKNDENDTVLSFLNDTYTDDLEVLTNEVEKIKILPKKSAYNKSYISGADVEASDLYFSIWKGLNELTRFDNHRCLIVFSGGFNNRFSSHTSSQTAMEFAKKNEIPVFSIQYKQQGFEHHKMTDLCIETYGNEVLTSSVDNAVEYFASAFDRDFKASLGKMYWIDYNSSFKADGALHTAILDLKGTKQNISFTAPKRTFFERIWNKYGYLTLIPLFLLLLLIGLIILLVIRNRSESKADSDFLKTELERQKHEANQSFSELKNNENEIQNYISESKAKEELKRKEKITFDLTQKMRASGKLPEIHYFYNKETVIFPILKPLIKVGRAKNNDIIIDESYISREHVHIYFNGISYMILDRNSTAGTKLNGKTITSQKLINGDKISLGSLDLYFKI